MTRQHFIDTVNDWGDLITFCNDHQCSVCEDVYDEYGRDEMVDEMVNDWARHDSWTDLRDRLAGIPDYDGYFRYDDYGDWYELDNYSDFDGYKDEVLEWGDDNDVWDEDEEEDEDAVDYEPAPDEPDEEPVEYEGFSPSDLFAASGEVFSHIEIEIPQPTPEPDPEPTPEPAPEPILPLESLSTLLG